MRLVVYKHDVAISLANALMALGKNDVTGTRYHIEQAQRNHEQWLEDRPERKFLQDREAKDKT